MSNYNDPFAQLFCVAFNNSPKMGKYYVKRGDHNPLSAAEIKEIE